MFKKPDEPSTASSPSLSSPPPTRRLTDVAQPAATVVGPGTRIRGDLWSEGSVEIAGTLEGDCEVSGLVRVREGARLTGNLTAGSAVVHGEIEGRTLTAERVEIGGAARVHADIRAHRVAIADGGVFEGRVQMDDGAAPSDPLTFKEKRKGPREGEPPAQPS
jgi:cytoskeletal protein CcmA (bactofilin family)